jgi:hypothetical protein
MSVYSYYAVLMSGQQPAKRSTTGGFLQVTTTERTVRLNVTADDIAMGVRKDPEWCPIALALRRAFPDARSVEVNMTSAHVYGQDYHCRAPIPDRAWLFTIHFDQNVKTFGFLGLLGRKPLAQPFSTDFTFTCRDTTPSADSPHQESPVTGDFKTDTDPEPDLDAPTRPMPTA